tara:strand:- start:1004 stop:1354 length:351 start_codon:yes stop_codon:yes gene_type:complete
MKAQTKDQLRAEVQKLRGQLVDLKFLARDEFTVTMNKDQFTLLMDRLWRDVSDMQTAMHAAEESDDPRFDGYANLVLLQGGCQIEALYASFKRQTATSWDFNVGTQKLYMSDEGEL